MEFAMAQGVAAEPILELDGLTKQYEGFLLDHISFTVPRGMIYGLVGENGAGKTTMLSLLLNLIEKDSGSIRVFGEDHVKAERGIKQRIGVVMDGLRPYPRYFVRDLQNVMSHIYQNWDRELFYQKLKEFKLPLDKKIKDLSKGMTVKLNFAVALAHHPELLILDEATSGLDPVVRDEVLTLLQEFVLDERNSVLLCTHITSDLDKIADYIVFLHEGQLRFIRSREDLDTDMGVVNCGQDLFEAIPAEDVEGYMKERFGYRVLIRNKAALKAAFRELPVDPAKVEDVMLFHIKGEKKR